MGCVWCKLSNGTESSNQGATDEQPKFSWEVGPKVDPKDFTIEDQNNVVAGRLPGEIAGQQFIISNCKNCTILLFDYINTITVDDCESCTFYIGPVQTSIFIRDCKDCKFIVACQQFRTRDCQRLDCFLCCVSQPIIEASSKMRFGPFCFYYPELLDQFSSSQISPFNCNWSEIHDFTPVNGEENFSLVSYGSNIAESFKIDVPDDHKLGNFIKNSVSLDPGQSAVPQTYGSRRHGLTDEKCLALVFAGREAAMQLIDRAVACGLKLVKTWQLRLTAEDGERLLQTSHYAEFFGKDVICLELNGVEASSQLQSLTSDDKNFYVSSDSAVADRQLDILSGIINMQMNTQ